MSCSPRRAFVLAVVASLLHAAAAAAGGGPRNVLVVVNENAEESLEIGAYYLRARHVPAANLCRIRTTTALTIDKAGYQAEIETPVLACIAASPYAARIDYLVLTRGCPIRAAFPGGDVSVTALLQAADTPLRGKDQEYAPPYGFQNYPNPYRKRAEWFAHGKAFGGYNLYLATMLSGYWSEEARALVDRSLASDGRPPTAAGGTFFLEDAVTGAADVRNADFPGAVTRLQGLGFAAVHVVHADPDVTGAVVAAHVNAGSYSDIQKAEIDANTYPPGCLVDVLESFGLVPDNFTPDAPPAQTPVTWWVSAGATGAHGTVSEPYNVAFPDGDMLEPWVAGFNLAETYYQGIPYLYWMNLVLGDPLAAPYATPPTVLITEPADGATVSGPAVRIAASASTPAPGGIFQLEVWVDDRLVDIIPAASGSVDWSAPGPDGWHRIEVVAYENSLRYAQATARIDVNVDAGGRSIAITAPAAGARVAGVFAMTLDAVPGFPAVTVRAEGLTVGGGPSADPVAVDTALLGRGWHTFVATAESGPALAAISRGVDLYVVKAPRVRTLGPASGPQSGGTAVAIDGWNLEPEVAVLFGGRPAAITWTDANHVVATTPTGPAGPVDVRVVNPLGLEAVLPGAFTYTPAPCPATDRVAGLSLVRAAGGRLELSWDAGLDPCFASYRVRTVVDPAAPPAFPADWTDVTALDEDGDAGGDAGYRSAPGGGGGLELWTVTAVGQEGTEGPP